MANTPKRLTPKDLEEIEMMAGLGLRYEDIARIKGMSEDTLSKYGKEELSRGKAKAKAAVMQTAYKLAISGKHPAMTMFWLKTQASWRENLPELKEEAQFKPLRSDGLDSFLENTIEQVKNGQLDPRIAQSVGYLSGILLKVIEQRELEERLSDMERIVKAQHQPSTSLMDTAIAVQEPEIQFIQKAMETNDPQ